MPIFHTHTLQRKAYVYVLLPTFALLMALGWGGYLFAKNSLLKQWSQTADANLQKAAHLVDMRLSHPRDLLERLRFSSGTGMAHLTLRYTLEQLDKMKGVVGVSTYLPFSMSAMSGNMGRGGMRNSSQSLIISSPRYLWENGDASVSLLSDIHDPDRDVSGTIKIKISVDDIVKRIAGEDWWKGSRALLLDMSGNIIVQSIGGKQVANTEEVERFGATDSLEKKTLASLQQQSHGTVFGEGNPPQEIIGFYRLSDAPWSMVVVAPGDLVLKPILKFSFYYGLLFVSAILVIIFFIRSVTMRMTRSVRRISIAAENLAGGEFGPSLPIRSRDEIGELTKSFNKMASQLKKGVALQRSMEIAREVQQNFLPRPGYSRDGVKLYGACRYSQETGGDFFDYLEQGRNSKKSSIIVGDVVGHGVGAALLMASVRAMLRARSYRNDSPEDTVASVNKILCADTAENSNFVTLFFLSIDRQEKTIEWVRAGHEPALLIYPERQASTELYGEGVAVGIDEAVEYTRNKIDITAEDQLVVIGSDGAWEAENSKGERFGKQRLFDTLMANSKEDPEVIVNRINHEINDFLDGMLPQDDITFVIAKIDGRTLHEKLQRIERCL